jgi:hypothetical protein
MAYSTGTWWFGIYLAWIPSFHAFLSSVQDGLQGISIEAAAVLLEQSKTKAAHIARLWFYVSRTGVEPACP